MPKQIDAFSYKSDTSYKVFPSEYYMPPLSATLTPLPLGEGDYEPEINTWEEDVDELLDWTANLDPS